MASHDDVVESGMRKMQATRKLFRSYHLVRFSELGLVCDTESSRGSSAITILCSRETVSSEPATSEQN